MSRCVYVHAYVYAYMHAYVCICVRIYFAKTAQFRLPLLQVEGRVGVVVQVAGRLGQLQSFLGRLALNEKPTLHVMVE